MLVRVETEEAVVEHVEAPKDRSHSNKHELQVKGVVDGEEYGEKQLKERLWEHIVPVGVSEIAVREGILNVVEEGAEQNTKAKDEKEESSNKAK